MASVLDRRQLLRGSLGLTGVLPLCCTSPEIARESFTCAGPLLVIDLAKAPELRPVGAAAAVVDTTRKLNLIVVHPEKNRFAALSRSCTHGGAQCAYNHKRRTVQCTSLNHAEYDLAGILLHGRTHGNLKAYPSRLAGKRLEIRLEAES